MQRLTVLLLMLASALFRVPGVCQLQPFSSQSDFYFAHVVDGGPAMDRATTQFRVINPNPFTVTGTLQFYDTSGGALAVDFGTGEGSLFQVTVLAGGSSRFETIGGPPTIRTGFVEGHFEAPVQATSEFRFWRGDTFANGASVDGISPNLTFWTFADFFTGIAVANPHETSVTCFGTFVDSNGNIQAEHQLTLGALNQTAYTLGGFLSLPQNAVGSYYIECFLPVVSLAIAGNNQGITSSLPSGAFEFPKNHEAIARRVFKHLVSTLNRTIDGALGVGNPQLTIWTNQVIDAYAIENQGQVGIELALLELLADSPSELAWALGHELGHIFQFLNGQLFHADPEIDADLYAILANIVAGYDPYAGAGVLGKLSVAARRPGMVSPQFDELADPLASFTNRMVEMMDEIELLCSDPDVAAVCEEYHDFFHPHLPGPLGNEPKTSQQGERPLLRLPRD